MTAVAETPADSTPVPEGHVRLVIDGTTVDAPKGELIIRTCERIGIIIPRFCDHPLLDPAGACRQCLVEVEMGGRPMPKPQASCTITVADGMVVKTQHSSPVAAKAQAGMMELLLINHPLDCPVCDKGGECPLQNQSMTSGRADSRFTEAKRAFPKPLPISTQVLLDRERCVLCQRCTRFSSQIAGDEFIELLERGSNQQVGVAADQPFQSYFSGNTIQICPVGALTSAAYRFRSRPFDLMSTPGVCEHCASGCAQRTDWRRGTVQRRLAAPDPEVNEEWSCDKGRFAFGYLTDDARITRPQVRGADGALHEASWTDALRAAADGLLAARGAGVGVLPGGRLTLEDAYAWSAFARVALHTNDIDARARVHSAEELEFLAAHVVGTSPETGGVTYAELETAPTVVCVGFEPEEESPIVFLRLRKAARAGTRVLHVAAWASPAVVKTGGHLVPAVPGAEVAALSVLDLPAGTVVLVGERAAAVPGLLSAVSALGARVAWIPRRAGERGAVEAGALPTLLPGGRAVADAGARTALEAAWRLEPGTLPGTPGRSTDEILAAALSGELGGLVVGGVELDDLPDPGLARRAVAAAGFVVSLELRRSEVTALADVVLPVAPDANRDGSYLDWEGRPRPFRTTLDGSGALPDCRVLDTLAVEMDTDLFTQTPAAAGGELRRLGVAVTATAAPTTTAATVRTPGSGQAVLATWRLLLDDGALQSGEPALAGTRRAAVARTSARTAARLGLVDGELLAVASEHGGTTLPLEVADVVDDVVWVPTGSATTGVLGVGHGSLVTVTGGRRSSTVTGGSR
ncbi:NADH-quinone oxidoreductase subunit G [Rhodococcus antarcticus]|uniref:NADH-quinone oxidoreductase n=1 Tax=Rhodococcus antarcticus TaxID=2987751 RepID=A0ABY6P0V1_9NOCA|nr:NADH-quinone oxidoreductase subunit G [Rhodococcus antarcticus]UZJ25275.1 NADH-quinone oxidoreductase subunit G [Rhodococcus antarcticus]